MTSEPVRERILSLIRTGLDAGIARLTQITGAPWEAASVSIREGKAADMRQDAAGRGAEHRGAIFKMPGGVFSVSFPAASATAVTQAFFGRFSKNADTWKDKEGDAVAEISNMVVNPVANVLGDAVMMVIFLTSPQETRGDWGASQDQAFDQLLLWEDQGVMRVDIHLECGPLSSSCAMLILFNSALAERFCESLGDKTPGS